MDTTGTKGKRTRARLLEAARQLFVEGGYHGTSMRQIAERAEIALGGIYYHFADKEDVFVNAMMEHNPYADLLPALQASQGETVEELARDAARRVLATMGQRPDSMHLLFVEIVEFKGQHLPQLFENLLPQTMSFAQRLVQASGTLRPIPLPTLARAFVGSFFAYNMTEWLMGDQFPAELQDQALNDFVDIYLYGIVRT